MSIVEAWITEDYARERDEKIKSLIAAGKDPWTPWTDEKARELKEEAKASGIRFRRKTLSDIGKLGGEGFVAKAIEELKEEIERFKNPTPEDKYKYTEAYFRDHIRACEDSLLFYEALLSDKKKLKATFESYKKRLHELEKADPITEQEDVSPETIVRTKYPDNYITPIDKVSNLLLTGELEDATVHRIAMEKRGSKKEITTLTSIDFDKLNGTVEIRGRKGLTPYDREVHDAIVTLNIDGGNEYITPQMIYQVMTGNPKAYLNPKQAKAIHDSVTKCIRSLVTIDASEEAKAYGFDKFKYEGHLIQADRVTATLNGEEMECLRILRTPILYEYANKKNQIGRVDIKMLNTPINKTEEIITLQGYLYRRVLAMKGSKLSKSIVYDTVYKYIDVTAATDGALRKKKSKIRTQVKEIFEYWKQAEFILDFEETKKSGAVYSISVSI